MKLSEIVEKCKSLEIHEERTSTDDNYEVVFFSDEIDSWRKILNLKSSLII